MVFVLVQCYAVGVGRNLPLKTVFMDIILITCFNDKGGVAKN